MLEVYTPDASVLLKWVFDSQEEDDKDIAMSFLDAWVGGRIEIILPRLWSFEVGNVLMLKSSHTAQELMEIFIGYDFREADTTPELCKETFSLMRNYKVTFYDAVYHAVAALNEGLLVTADDAYWRKTKDTKNVIRLGEWK